VVSLSGVVTFSPVNALSCDSLSLSSVATLSRLEKKKEMKEEEKEKRKRVCV